jgi:hypothetical protein
VRTIRRFKVAVADFAVKGTGLAPARDKLQAPVTRSTIETLNIRLDHATIRHRIAYEENPATARSYPGVGEKRLNQLAWPRSSEAVR